LHGDLSAVLRESDVSWRKSRRWERRRRGFSLSFPTNWKLSQRGAGLIHHGNKVPSLWILRTKGGEGGSNLQPRGHLISFEKFVPGRGREWGD
jgi:hypothetical protein